MGSTFRPGGRLTTLWSSLSEREGRWTSSWLTSTSKTIAKRLPPKQTKRGGKIAAPACRRRSQAGSDRGARKERAARVGRNFPLPPICRSPINQLLGFRVNPPLEDTAAWKDKGVRPSWLNGASSGHGRTVQSMLVANSARNLDPLHRLGCFDLRSTNHQGLPQEPIAGRATD
jgi:hypothetical protein